MEARFQQAMDNDFNTAQAQGIFFDAVKAINRIHAKIAAAPCRRRYSVLEEQRTDPEKTGGIMGLLREDAQQFSGRQKEKMIADSDIDVVSIDALIAERYQCRLDKNWARSDEIRDQLLAKNIELRMVRTAPPGPSKAIRP